MKLLFWNVDTKDVSTELAELCDELAIDVLILAESYAQDDAAFLLNLNSKLAGGVFTNIYDPAIRVRTYYRAGQLSMQIVRDTRYATIKRMQPVLGPDFLLVALHMPSKLHASDIDQLLVATRISEMIREAEGASGHDRTIAVGDFNMNPFEDGVAAADGFHAVSDIRIASQGSRVVAEVQRPFFYNPMWSFLGDRSNRLPGSYFYRSSHNVAYFWNVFDQWLFRPTLLNSYNLIDVRIVDECRSISVKGHDMWNCRSDHLPIYCH